MTAAAAPGGVPPSDPPVEVTAGQGRRPRRRLRIALGVLGVVLLAALAVAVWWLQPQPLLPEARAALTSTDQVSVTDDRGWLEFTPTGSPPTVGLIFYPGGKVEPAGYARSAQAIASEGYLVAIPPMPLNLAVLGADAADAIIAAHPGIRAWVIAGHSLGGAMAGQYADRHPGAVAGLVLWAAFPNGDLSDQPDLPTVSTWGSLDAGAARFGSEATLATLPAGTTISVIEGGNHEQMGDYTGQPNDPPATITRDEQQARAQAVTLSVLHQVSGEP